MRTLTLLTRLAPLVLAACAAPRAGGGADLLQADSLGRAGEERRADLTHLEVEVRVDPRERTVEGVSSSWFRGLRSSVDELRLHAAGLEVLGIEDASGRELRFRVEGEELQVELAAPLRRGEEEVVRVRYRARPETGLHFREARRFSAEPVPLAFSQGQPNDHRHWLPLWDEPNDRATLEVRARVPEEFEALANGRLVAAERHADGTRTWHWRLDEEVPTYLLGLAVGRFDRVRDAVGEVELEYAVPAGAGEDRARRAFGETPAMLAWMEEHLQEPFPYARYGQVALEGFVIGGMENATLTFVHDPIVCDEGEALDLGHWPRRLVAHELAHQWFGDLVTCWGWRDLWLNEAFASWMELAWLGQAAGEPTRRLALEECAERFLRSADPRMPLSAGWRVAGACPDAAHHVYTKGPWVIEMLRRAVGPEDFDRAVAHYLDRHAGGFVETADLVRAVFDTTGHNLRPLVQQWVEGGGAPRLEVRQEERGDALHLVLRQVQEVDDLVPLFRLEVEVEVVTGSGRGRHRIELAGREAAVDLPLDGTLLDVVVDPDGDLLMELDHLKPVDQWVVQAMDGGELRDPSPGAASVRSWRAVPALASAAAGSDPAGYARDALLGLLAFHAEPALRTRAARAVPASPEARDAWVAAAVEDDDALVRRACLERLVRSASAGALRGGLTESQRARLEERLGSEPSPRARQALGQLLGVRP
ncbi:MAG: M1 family metallopeptidase [Planctomycetes bacterium]|nr:M1 family metallopeptidase [Planctomycetota bacterium]